MEDNARTNTPVKCNKCGVESFLTWLESSKKDAESRHLNCGGTFKYDPSRESLL